MANVKFLIGNINKDGVVYQAAYYLADTDAGKPTSGLNVGDICWAVDNGILYLASSSTTWIPVPQIALTQTWAQTQIFDLDVYFKGSGSNFNKLSGQALSSDKENLLPNVKCMLTGVGYSTGSPFTGGMARVNETAKTAAIASTNLTDATVAGLYRVTYYLRCTTADVTAGTIQFNCTYTDSVGATTDSSAVVALTSTVNRAQGTIVADLASGNITYSTTLTGIAGTSQYKLRVRCEYLG